MRFNLLLHLVVLLYEVFKRIITEEVGDVSARVEMDAIKVEISHYLNV